MVKSEQIYSPQQYLEAITDKCYIMRGEDDITFIHDRLAENGIELWDYPITEIDHIVEHQHNVVLVDCMVVNEETDQFEHQYRWFEVPEYAAENFN